MPIRFKPFDADSLDDLQQKMLATYFHRECYELAIALNRGLDWGMVMLQHTGKKGTTVRHAGVRHPDGGFFDARGRVAEDLFMMTFESVKLIDCPFEDILKQQGRPVLEYAIHCAGQHAMRLWPQLPWSNSTSIGQMIEFLDDLERLCRQHGFWIADANLAATNDEEVGYELAVSTDGEYAVNKVTAAEVDLGRSADSSDALAALFLPQPVEECLVDQCC